MAVSKNEIDSSFSKVKTTSGVTECQNILKDKVNLQETSLLKELTTQNLSADELTAAKDTIKATAAAQRQQIETAATNRTKEITSNPPSPYDILGLQQNSTSLEITKKYRTKSVRWHPDTNKDDPIAVAVIKEINEAYATLKAWDEKAKVGPIDPVEQVLNKIKSIINSISILEVSFEGKPDRAAIVQKRNSLWVELSGLRDDALIKLKDIPEARLQVEIAENLKRQEIADKFKQVLFAAEQTIQTTAANILKIQINLNDKNTVESLKNYKQEVEDVIYEQMLQFEVAKQKFYDPGEEWKAAGFTQKVEQARQDKLEPFNIKQREEKKKTLLTQSLGEIQKLEVNFEKLSKLSEDEAEVLKETLEELREGFISTYKNNLPQPLQAAIDQKREEITNALEKISEDIDSLSQQILDSKRKMSMAFNEFNKIQPNFGKARTDDEIREQQTLLLNQLEHQKADLLKQDAAILGLAKQLDTQYPKWREWSSARALPPLVSSKDSIEQKANEVAKEINKQAQQVLGRDQAWRDLNENLEKITNLKPRFEDKENAKGVDTLRDALLKRVDQFNQLVVKASAQLNLGEGERPPVTQKKKEINQAAEKQLKKIEEEVNSATSKIVNMEISFEDLKSYDEVLERKETLHDRNNRLHRQLYELYEKGSRSELPADSDAMTRLFQARLAKLQKIMSIYKEREDQERNESRNEARNKFKADVESLIADATKKIDIINTISGDGINIFRTQLEARIEILKELSSDKEVDYKELGKIHSKINDSFEEFKTVFESDFLNKLQGNSPSQEQEGIKNEFKAYISELGNKNTLDVANIPKELAAFETRFHKQPENILVPDKKAADVPQQPVQIIEPILPFNKNSLIPEDQPKVGKAQNTSYANMLGTFNSNSNILDQPPQPKPQNLSGLNAANKVTSNIKGITVPSPESSKKPLPKAKPSYMNGGAIGGMVVGIAIGIGLMASGILLPLGAAIIGGILLGSILGGAAIGAAIGKAVDSFVEKATTLVSSGPALKPKPQPIDPHKPKQQYPEVPEHSQKSAPDSEPDQQKQQTPTIH